MFNDNVGELANLDITDNFVRGGRIPFNAGGLSLDTSVAPFLGRIWRNVFTRDAGISGYTINLDTSYASPSSCDTGDGTPNQNVYTDGTPVRVHRNG